MKTLIAALATASMLAFAGSAFAGPVQLTNHQMDTVSAGGVGGVVANLMATAAGTLAAGSESQVTLATAIQTPTPYPGPGTLPTTLTVLVAGFNIAAN